MQIQKLPLSFRGRHPLTPLQLAEGWVGGHPPTHRDQPTQPCPLAACMGGATPWPHPLLVDGSPHPLGVYMQADSNRLHLLSALIRYSHMRMRLVKNYCLHMRIAILGYVNAVNNHIRIPFIYNIYFLYTL